MIRISFSILWLINTMFGCLALTDTSLPKNNAEKIQDAVSVLRMGQVSISSKIKPGDSADTTKGAMCIKFQKNREDTPEIFLNAVLTTGSADFQVVYNGHEIFITDPVKKLITRIDPKKYGYGFVIYRSLLYYLFAPLHPLLVDRTVKELFADPKIAETKDGRDSIVNGEPCHEIILKYKPLKNIYKSNITWIYANWRTGLVMRSVNVLVNAVGEIQYTEFNIRYDSVNNLSRGDNFSFDALPSDFSMEEYSDTKREQYLQTGTIDPEFTLKDMNGNKISLSDYHGKLILVHFWFLNCGYCIQSMPEIEAISTHYQNLGLVVLGINAYETDKQRLGKFFQVNKIDFPQLIAGLEVSGFYRVFSYPADYLIDPQGKIIYAGSFDGGKIISLIEPDIRKDHLNKKPA